MPDQLFFDIVKMVVALACIVGLVFGSVYLLKRLVPGIARPGVERVDLFVIAQLSMGSRQRVSVVRVHDKTLVLGVTEGSITTLAELPTPKTATQKEADDPKIFADLLSWRKDAPAAAPGVAAQTQPSAAPKNDARDDGPRLFAPGERAMR